MKVLVTLGGTRERIDDVRFISNLSTGRTGCVIAGRLGSAGCAVTCLCGRGSERPRGKNLRIVEFTDFKDLDLKIKTLLKSTAFDAVIHLAAVGDYSVKLVRAGAKTFNPRRGGKITSAARTITLVLAKNFKILDRIKGYARGHVKPYDPLLAGFKLTSGAPLSRVLESVRCLKAADIVVHNDLAEMKNGHPFHIYKNGTRVRDCGSARELAADLASMISARRCGAENGGTICY